MPVKPIEMIWSEKKDQINTLIDYIWISVIVFYFIL